MKDKEAEHSHLKANLITSRPSHIAHPLDRAVITLLKDLQVTHQQTGRSKHENTKGKADRRPTPGLLVGHRSKGRLSIENKLTLARETRDLPDNIVVFGFILRSALARPLSSLGRVQWCRNTNDHIRSEELRTVIRLDRNAVLDLGRADLTHNWLHLKGEVDILRRAVPHQLELTVRRYERDDTVRVKSAQFHALVELTVFQCDGTCGCARGLASGSADPTIFTTLPARRVASVEEKPVIQPEFALRRAGQVGAHDDLAVDVGAENSAGRGH